MAAVVPPSDLPWCHRHTPAAAARCPHVAPEGANNPAFRCPACHETWTLRSYHTTCAACRRLVCLVCVANSPLELQPQLLCDPCRRALPSPPDAVPARLLP